MFQVQILNVAGVWVPLGKPCVNHGDAMERVKRFRAGDRKHGGSFEYRIAEVENANPTRA